MSAIRANIGSGGSVPTEADWSAFYGQMLRASGLDLYSYKPEQIRRRILTSLDTFGYRDLSELGIAIVNSEAERLRLLDRLAINVTELYRNPDRWNHLATNVLPELLAPGKRLKCWSAGCSNGGEAYSLASLLAEVSTERHEILGTDIDTEALQAAKAGVYAPDLVQGVPPSILTKYFNKTSDGAFRVNEKLRQMVRFDRHNLLGTSVPGKFDLIVCRNVVIYFTDEAKEMLFQRFYEALNPGGYLFVGGSERIIEPKAYGYLNPWPFIYRKSI